MPDIGRLGVAALPAEAVAGTAVPARELKPVDDALEAVVHLPEDTQIQVDLAGAHEAGEEASLVLAAGAVEDYEDDWDEEDDWSEDFSDEDNDSIRLSLGSNSSLDFLRDLEERRSFKAPIWGPRPDSTGFDEDVSLYEESDEDVLAFDDYEDVDSDDDDLVRFDDDLGASGPASVRVGVMPPQRTAAALRARTAETQNSKKQILTKCALGEVPSWGRPQQGLYTREVLRTKCAPREVPSWWRSQPGMPT